MQPADGLLVPAVPPCLTPGAGGKEGSRRSIFPLPTLITGSWPGSEGVLGFVVPVLAGSWLRLRFPSPRGNARCFSASLLCSAGRSAAWDGPCHGYGRKQGRYTPVIYIPRSRQAACSTSPKGLLGRGTGDL